MRFRKNWVLYVDPAALKQLEKFPARDAKRIFITMQELPLDPFAGDIQKMKAEDYIWRRRVGAFRIFYELIPRKGLIHVFRFERRTSKTY